MTGASAARTNETYFQAPGSGPRCSTARSAQVRQRRFEMGYEKRTEPEPYTRLAQQAKEVFLRYEEEDPALARARAMSAVVEGAPVELEPGNLLLGGENPFFFNLLLPALQADRYARSGPYGDDPEAEAQRQAGLFYAACFEGHITPGLEFVLGQGIEGLRWRVEESRRRLPAEAAAQRCWCEAALLSCDNVLAYARRYQEAAFRLAGEATEPDRRAELRELAEILGRVPAQPARSLHEALQSYWLVYILVTTEMGGCCPGGGLGLGRMDQYLFPYYERDLASGRLTREQALELMELFLLCFRHVDYYTGHQTYTPGSQASLGGVTPTGLDAANALTELIMEASLRIALPAPYISLRLHRDAPERYWQAAADYIVGGLGFPVVNDEVLIPAFLRHGRSLGDARDYICSCCYENTIPGREAFHPNAAYLNLPLVLELALNQGRVLLTGQRLGSETVLEGAGFEAVWAAFRQQLHQVAERLSGLVNRADAAHAAYRRYPLMSLFIEDCIARATDVGQGGARYNPTGCIVAGLPNVVNSLAAIRHCVDREGTLSLAEIAAALEADFSGHEGVHRRLLAAPKWGNGDDRVDDLAAKVTEALFEEFGHRTNPRGGPWQLALYSFVANHGLGQVVGASADGRAARAILTRNLNPSWGTDRQGPTAVLESLSRIDFTQFPNGCSLDLRFDPALLDSRMGRSIFAGFLKGFVDLGVMQMQISMVDTATLLDAREHPERWPNLMVKVAGYSARFVDLSDQEKEELINRTAQRLAAD
ncbi:MAG: pyruvate formate lyase family protein [Candidatus Latescibacterota bacterium]